MRILLFILLWLPAALWAQHDTSYTFTLRKYDVADGLAHRRVNAIVQDRDGFLWLATPAGVQRFDGYTFTLLTVADGLQANEVGGMWMDGNGLLWLFYNVPNVNFCTGVDILDPRTGRVETFEAHFGPDAPVRANEFVSWVRFAEDSTMLIGAQGRLVSYHPRRGLKATPKRGREGFNPMERNADGSLLGISFNPDRMFDRLVLRNADGTDRDTLAEQRVIAPLTGHVRSVEEFLRAGGSGAVKGTYFAWQTDLDSPPGEAWMPRGGSPGLLRATDASREPWAMHRRDLGNGLWIVHTTVRRMSAGGDPLKADVLFDLAAEHPEVDFRLHHVFVDAGRTVWLCTEFGLFRLVIRPSRFQRFLWQKDIPSGFGKRVRGMLVKRERSSGQGARLLVNTEMEGFWSLDADNGRVLGRDTARVLHYSIAEDEQGMVWRNAEDTVREYLSDGLSATGRWFLTPHACWAMYPMGGSMVAESADGMARYAADGGAELRPLRPAHDQAVNAALHMAVVMHIGRDRSGTLWACATNGFYRLGADGGAQERWSLEEKGAHRIPATDIRHFLEDEHGVFWIATGDGGLLRWDRVKDEVRAITMRDGLPSNAVHAVYADARGMRWLPTDNGLVRYDPSSGRITVYTTADGIAQNEFNRLAHCQGPDGRLYFGGLNGITAFDPMVLGEREASTRVPLLITQVQQLSSGETAVIDRSVEVRAGSEITLRPGDRFVNIAFALLSYEDPASILYGWRIDGVDNDWNYQREPSLRITSLPYGDHLLRIKAQGSDGIWSARELTLPLHVVRPVHLRWWFIALCALAVSAVVYAIFRYRLAQARKVLAMRDRIAADLHDEVGSSLSNIAMFGELMRDQLADQPPKVRRMVERITSNSAKALESMNDIVWNVNTRYEGTEHLVARMRAFAAQAAEAKGFALRFEAEEALRAVKLDMMHRKHLYLVFKEAVNNAAKYSGCTELKVSLAAQGAGMRLVVADNGRGFAEGEQDARGGGQGLAGMRKRADDIGAELTVRSVVGEGTTIILSPSGNGRSRTLGTRPSVGSGSFAP
ncbi:MAG: hypothetical protein JNL05_00085 [Flavobacteriales bacterium]|nr:hypothetical protein [Flavobacteriales bacterium]